jgi:hypothetical protein
LAGFQVATYGRFWVATEGQKLKTRRREWRIGPHYIIDIGNNFLLWQQISDLPGLLAELDAEKAQTAA